MTGARSGSSHRVRDVLVIGAGITGIYQLYRLCDAGYDVQMLEAGSGVGGTWFWNRYPGCRFDSESYSYGYLFSPELMDEWTWSEEYAAQPETERYLNYVVDKFELRRAIEFDARVVSMTFDDDDGVWSVTTQGGQLYRSRFVVTALGILSAPIFPAVPGLGEYQGEWHHTALWPEREVSFKDKRVAVIGTGSSGVQIIPLVAKEAASLTVFQRTPNWCAPINNSAIAAQKMDDLRKHRTELWQRCMASPSGSIHSPKPMLAMDLTPDERLAAFEELYNAPGLTLSLANFPDVSQKKEVNDILTAFLADKIRAKVDDAEVAERLIPKDHGFGQKRPPLETQYYETYNQPNVTLVSTQTEPMQRITETGIRTSEREFDFDLIIFATGFEAVVGSFNRIDITGTGGAKLVEHWDGGARTYLGIQSVGFPNLFIVGGPQSTAGNIPRYTEVQVDWVMDCLNHMNDKGYTRVQARPDAEDYWNELIYSTIEGTLQATAESWAWGSNVPGKKRGTFLLYAGGLQRYRGELDRVRDSWDGLEFS